MAVTLWRFKDLLPWTTATGRWGFGLTTGATFRLARTFAVVDFPFCSDFMLDITLAIWAIFIAAVADGGQKLEIVRGSNP